MLDFLGIGEWGLVLSMSISIVPVTWKLTQSFTFIFRFNLIRFASEVVSWKPHLTSTSDDSCQNAVEWVSDFDANGSTSTLSALQVYF